MTYQLQITPSVGRRWTCKLEKPLTKIGRAAHCEVVLNDPLVSREHALLQITAEGPRLEDLNSANGTLVNDQRITRIALHPGDKVRLGLSELVLELIPEKMAAPSPPPRAPEVQEAGVSGTEQPQPSPPGRRTPEPLPPGLVGAGPTFATAQTEPRSASDPGSALRAEALAIRLFSPNQEPPVILVAHPECRQIEALLRALDETGVRLLKAAGAEEVRQVLETTPPDCVLLCPGTEKAADLCQTIRSHPRAGPVVLILRRKNWAEAAALFRAGADEVLQDPDPLELLVRVRSMLEMRRLRNEATAATAQVEKRVSDDVSEAERINRLKRYLSPQLVAAVLSGEESHVLKPTRQEVTIVFSDLRNYTHFSEVSEPEEVITMLKDFHSLYGEIIFQYDGTLERFAGDGVMVFFGAPVRFKDHARRAVAMAVTARERLKGLRSKWERLGYTLDISFGISTGYVFVGNIGFESRMDYAAIGKTTNLAARLCAAAKGGQILISRKTLFQVEDLVEVEEIGGLEVKGFSEPVMAYNVLDLKAPFVPAPVT
ncbi:MAG: FHA domain-containing protein [Desulfobacterota bacterium]|nr:FHA domain-containing protein [Thermodesulfobacteriota bacterium]